MFVKLTPIHSYVAPSTFPAESYYPLVSFSHFYSALSLYEENSQVLSFASLVIFHSNMKITLVVLHTIRAVYFD